MFVAQRFNKRHSELSMPFLHKLQQCWFLDAFLVLCILDDKNVCYVLRRPEPWSDSEQLFGTDAFPNSLTWTRASL